MVRTQTKLENALLLQIEDLHKKEPELPFLPTGQEDLSKKTRKFARI